ncbi:Gfo/Idh/MocA family protein [Mycetocola miduiensis]|uniref:Predicted dehydrogenase n=1 Tax=Mycetocola miduiensis TaxID=995034 RepID=A0A1I4YPN2_9MICO|nr:Gfo/Idh/MocA family oxidoreductase [Mycetocola miduiensis]SFN39984.1 Predicted dehydrogenase [Mycetocola miduiensis]
MKVAVIGGGAIGTVHAKAYVAAGAQLVGVVEPVTAVGERFSTAFGVPVFDTLDSLLAGDNPPEAISICTPPFTHRQLAEVAMKAGVHVLCEKPMAHTIEDARALHRSAEASNVTFATAYCHRFQPELELIHSHIETGEIGTVRTFFNAFSGHQDDIETRWFGRKELAGGGALIDAGIHSIDIFRYLCGEVDSATGTLATVLDGTGLEVEHTAAMTLRSVTHVIGTIECSWKSPTGQSIVRVEGSEGSLTFDYARQGQVAKQSRSGEVEILQVSPGNRFEREIADFIRSVTVGMRPRTGSLDGLVGVAVLDEVYSQSDNRSLGSSILNEVA